MPTDRKPVKSQVMVITGASSGIGLATALAAADRGAKVVLAARSETTLTTLADHLTTAGASAVSVIADVSRREDVERIATTAIETWGRIDTWVNDAAVGAFGRLDDMLDDDSRRIFDINFWGVVYGSLVALPHLKASRGTLINLGSEVSEAVIPLQGIYSASKHAVKAFTDALRLELEADGSPVRIALVQPTAVNTPFPENAANYLKQEPKLPTPMIDPEKVAQAILNAAEDPADHIKVGVMSNVNTTMAKIAPPIAEQFAKLQMGRMQRDEPGHAREGTLYTAGERGRTHGRGNENPAPMRSARESNRKPA
ncbi:MAG: SDR family oxidoreductase [Chloroflexota bacterium]|nr:SDR family oxidoreductase [Chloroflexota bacterium]